MRDEDAFLQAIIDDPDNDTPRLIYADWLEEQGNPRAEFIRVQCELARGVREDGRHRELCARASELLWRYYDEWVAPFRAIGEEMAARHYPASEPIETPQLPEIAYVSSRVSSLFQSCRDSLRTFDFVRGFIEEIHLDREAFDEHADLLFRITPLKEIHFFNLPAWTPTLAASPHLARLTSLSLSNSRIDDEGLCILAASPYTTRLASLNLSFYSVGNKGLIALARSPYIKQLVSLNLWESSRIGEGVEALASSPNMAKLKDLNISFADIGDSAIAAVAGSRYMQNLERLSFRQNDVTSVGARAVAESLWNLNYVDASENPIGKTGRRALRRRRFRDGLQL